MCCVNQKNTPLWHPAFYLPQTGAGSIDHHFLFPTAKKVLDQSGYLFADTVPVHLQESLNAMYEYSVKWKLNINTSKTKIICFSRGKIRNIPSFHIGECKVEVVDEFPYLGIQFNYNSKFSKARKAIREKASRAMFSLLSKSRRLSLPIGIQLHLFDSQVVPVLLYGCEIWSHENCEDIEKLHLRYCKYILSLNRTTCSNMLYGELGRFPLAILMKVRSVTFWLRLVSGIKTKFSSILYQLLYKMYIHNIFKSPWLENIYSVLNETGFSYLWFNQDQISSNSIDSIQSLIQTRLHDQLLQVWSSDIFNSSKCINYRIFKTQLTFEPYLNNLPSDLRISLCKFRCRNHKLPIEIGCHRRIARDLRTCELCNKNSVGDEFHYLFECSFFNKCRKQYLPAFCRTNSSSFKFNLIMNHTNDTTIFKLSKFIKIILLKFI